jgi:hypothetical protein
MPKKFNNFVRGVIFGLSKAKFSYKDIINTLKENNIIISKKGIHSILRDKNITDLFYSPTEKFHKTSHSRIIRTPQAIQKVRNFVNVENPPTQKTIAKRLKTSHTTIQKIIKDDLDLKIKFKPRVHKLTTAHKSNRTTNCRYLYENYLAGDNWKKIITIDEAWFYLSDTNKKRSIYYTSRSKKDDRVWCRQRTESFPKGFMVMAGFSYQGKLKLRKIERNTKINSVYYQNNILSPIFKEEIPNLYGSETCNVVFHHDKAPSHVSQSTVNYLQRLKAETGINSIEPRRIPVKSPDCAPMDFCVFGLLKRRLGNRKPKTLDGLWKALNDEWNKLDMTILQRALLSWKTRCRSISMNHGLQIEPLKKFRYGLNYK